MPFSIKVPKLIKCIMIQIQKVFMFAGIKSKAVFLAYDSEYLDVNPKTFANKSYAVALFFFPK
jgi:hypothetical protein